MRLNKVIQQIDRKWTVASYAPFTKIYGKMLDRTLWEPGWI